MGRVMPDVRPTPAPPSKPRPARSPFSRLAVTHVISMSAEAFVTIALAGTLFFTVSPDSARPRVALFLILTMTPFAVVAPVLGPLMDRARSGRRFFVLFTCIGRAVLAWMMAIHRNSLLLFPLAFGVLVLSKGYSVAKSSMVPAVVRDDDALVEANSRLALVAVLGSFAGGIPAAAILQIGGSQWSLRAASVLYVIATLAAFGLPRAVPRPPEKSELARAELRRPTILLSATAMALLRAGVGFLTFFLAFALKRVGEPAWVYGVVIAASAVGGFFGAVVAPMLRRRVREESILLGAVLIPALAALFAARTVGIPTATIAALALGLGAGAGKLAFDALVQRDAPDADRSRAFARFETRFQLTWVAGGLLPVIVPLPTRVGFFALALTLGFAGLSYLGGVRASGRRVAVASPAEESPAPEPGGASG